MRIHGSIIIKRRDLIITNWKKHKKELEEDFSGICGYCGKSFKATFCDSQIEHFVPKKKYPEYENKYSNLVLACKVCNNKKREDWPSNDPNKNITNDSKRGYIDPATEEYDNHLKRLDDGNIIGLTDVGKYMVKRLGFDYRPISEIYKVNKLYEALQSLKEKKDKKCLLLNLETTTELLLELEDLRSQIHMRKE